MPIYDPYSFNRNNGMGQPIPFSNQLSLGNIGYQGGINYNPYSSPYINSNGYFGNNYNGYYNPYNGTNYWEEAQKQREEYEKNQFKVWELCERINGAALNKSKEEIENAIRSHDPKFKEQIMKQQSTKRVEIAKRNKEEMTARIIIKRGGKVVADSKKAIEKRKASVANNTNNIFSINQMQYIDNSNDYDETSRLQAEYIWRYGLVPVMVINPLVLREFEQRSKAFANTNIFEYFNNELGSIYWNGVLEEETEKRKAMQLKNRYDPNFFRNSLLQNTVGSPIYNNQQINYFKQPTQKSDLEIHLPSSMNSEYQARRKMFIDRIMQNAKRVGSDITMNGNINVNEVYNR